MPGDASHARFDVIKSEIVRAFGIATKETAEELLRRAKLEVPVGSGLGTGTAEHEPGQLRDSGRVDRIGPNDWSVSFNTSYALKQHEAQQYKHPQGGKSKYLEDPLKAMMAIMEVEVGERLSRILATVTRDASGRFARAGSPGSTTFNEIWAGGGALLR